MSNSCLHRVLGSREQRLHILRLGRIRHVSNVKAAALRDSLRHMGSWTTEGGARSTGSRRRRGLGAVALGTPVGGVKGTSIGADILIGSPGSYVWSVESWKYYGKFTHSPPLWRSRCRPLSLKMSVPTEQKSTQKLSSPNTTLESPHKLDRTKKPAKTNCARRDLSIHNFLFAFALFVRPEWGGHFFRCSTADYLALASDFTFSFFRIWQIFAQVLELSQPQGH